ncbi:hypothetical protein CRYUN_Cryun14cG0052700 [Craigia yunnanensis]
MLYLDNIDDDKRLYSNINGPGRELTPSLAIYETMQSLKSPIGTHYSPVGATHGQADDIRNEANELLTCGVEEVVRRWNVSSGECLHVYEKAGLGMVSYGWSPDGKWIFLV